LIALFYGETDMPPRVTVVHSSVRKICQLTGEFDRERNQPAFNQTESRFGLFGTDLGYSFEHDGRLWFLFGDTWPGPQTIQTTDSVAWTTDENPEPGIHLEFSSDNGRYRSPKLRDRNGAVLSTEAYEVPIAGVSSNGQMYVFHSTDRIDGQGGAGGLDVFWIGPDGAIGTTWANPAVDLGRWHSPFPTTPPASSRLQAPIAAVTRFGNALDTFWIGFDEAIGTTWSNPQTDAGNWQQPFPITPPGAARTDALIAAITRLEGALDVFWIGPDGAVGTTWANPRVDNSRWHSPFPITPPGAARTGSPIAAVTRLGGALDVFWIGPDGAVGTTWANPSVDDGRWHPPFPITPAGAARTDSPLAAVTRLDGALDVFWIGPDGAVGTTWANPRVDNSRWHSPFPITPPGAARAHSPLAVVTRLEGALDVFWIGSDGAVGTAWANPSVDEGRWHPPFPITPPGAGRDYSPLAVVTRLEGALDVFWIGPDDAVGTTWANPGIDSGRWHPPFPITPAGAARIDSSIAAVTRSSDDARTLMGRTVLARAQDNDLTDLVALYDVSRLDQDGKFINVACVVAAEGMQGLPFKSQSLLVWGSGRYRESDVYLACVPLNAIEDPAAWRFLTGWGLDAHPQWHEDQRLAVPLFDQRQVGELSVAWIEPLAVWLLLYNAGTPRGINARVASSPWGPWSDPFVLFDPGWPGLGYGHFMHVKDGADTLSDAGRKHEWGGEYGLYLIHRYTRGVASSDAAIRQAQVYFVLSTWNPYNTVLMTATIQRERER
jgi:hypothetical protein